MSVVVILVIVDEFPVNSIHKEFVYRKFASEILMVVVEAGNYRSRLIYLDTSGQMRDF